MPSRGESISIWGIPFYFPSWVEQPDTTGQVLGAHRLRWMIS